MRKTRRNRESYFQLSRKKPVGARAEGLSDNSVISFLAVYWYEQETSRHFKYAVASRPCDCNNMSEHAIKFIFTRNFLSIFKNSTTSLIQSLI